MAYSGNGKRKRGSGGDGSRENGFHLGPELALDGSRRGSERIATSMAIQASLADGGGNGGGRGSSRRSGRAAASSSSSSASSSRLAGLGAFWRSRCASAALTLGSFFWKEMRAARFASRRSCGVGC